MLTHEHNPADPVALQYEKWAYPAPVTDLATIPFNEPHCHYKDLRDSYWAYWPSAPYHEDLDILVAGCGSVSAAAYAFLYPSARVTGIDVSSAALGHEEFLRKKHGLDNLTLHHGCLEDVAALGSDFDFIAAHGVLHHLADPVAGLRSLGGVLRREGVLSLLVYGRYGRTGVYMLQELFRLLGLDQDAGGVRTVLEVLGALGPSHPVQRYLRLANDLGNPHGLVDTFLHKRDRPYTVAECLDLVHAAGLTFQGWEDNIFYYPDAQVPAGQPLGAALEKLHGPQLWQAMELVHGNIAGHYFYVCRPDRAEATYRIPFADQTFLDCIPVSRVDQVTPADPARQQPATAARGTFPAVRLGAEQAAVWSQIDNRRSIRECLLAAGIDARGPGGQAFGRTFFQSLWRVGYVVFRLPSAAAPVI